jgi:uncharacterized protein YneF (UPF0154 family)
VKISDEWLPVVMIACFVIGFWVVSLIIHKLKDKPPSG